MSFTSSTWFLIQGQQAAAPGRQGGIAPNCPTNVDLAAITLSALPFIHNHPRWPCLSFCSRHQFNVVRPRKRSDLTGPLLLPWTRVPFPRIKDRHASPLYTKGTVPPPHLLSLFAHLPQPSLGF